MDPARLSEALTSSMDAHAFSGVVSIRQRGRVLFERAAGYADRSNEVANTRRTRFGIASGTKFFTALAVGKLIAAGTLSFATRLEDCVALDVPHYPPGITLRHLLTHTSGIPDFYDEETITDFDAFFVDRPWYELKELRDYLSIFPDEPMKFPPGERFSYSNGGYILLGIVIEEATGRPYREVVEQEIFAATGMDRSGFFAFDRLPGETARGYIEDAEGWRTNIYNLPNVGASDGGAYTTVDDLATLWRAFLANEIVPRDLVETFTAPYVPEEPGGSTHYGHGLWIRETPAGHPEIYITGCDAGVSFRSAVRRAGELEVTVMSNTTDGAWPILREIDRTLA